MAEVLAIVASGMGVASLAMQVASSVKKLKDFCDRVKDTPSEIRDTLDDIETLSFVIDEIEDVARSGGHLPQGLHTALLRSTKRCLEASNELRSIVSEIEAAIQKHKLRGAVKGALKKSRLDEIRQRLESAKTTCLLAGQSHQRKQNENIGTSVLLLQQSFQTFSEFPYPAPETLPALPKECSAIGNTSMEPAVAPYYSSSNQSKSLWGFYQIHRIAKPINTNTSGSKARDSRRREAQILISAQLPQWLFRRRFDLHTSRSHSGWDFSINVYNVRPFDAPIFQYVEEENISAIQRSFEGNVASVFDVDVNGRSLLHVSGSNASASCFQYLIACKYALCNNDFVLHLETLKFLLECGAPIHVSDKDGFAPLLYLLHWGQEICFRSSQSNEFREALQCLLNYGSCPYTERTYKGFTSLELYSGSEDGQRMLLNSLPQQALSSEGFDVLNTIKVMVDHWVSNPLQLIHNLLPNGKLEPMTEKQKRRPILNCAMKYLCDPEFEDGWPAFIEELLDAGADVHGYRYAMGVDATPFWHLLHSNASLLSYSTSPMRTIRSVEDSLTIWLGILETCGYNVSDYLAEEEQLKEEYDQPLPDTLARVEINVGTGEVFIEREWAYLWREFDDKNRWDYVLDIPERSPDNFRLEIFWRCVEEDLEASKLTQEDLKMPGSWNE